MPWIQGNRYLSRSEMENNATLLWGDFKSKGWSLNAVCGMLGNMQTESSINPGIWENLTVNYNRGFGLVQWTPASKYINWAGSNYTDGYLQCERIQWELNNGQQYYPTSKYPMTFREFSVSTETPEYLAQVFITNYERPKDPDQPIRSTQAREWYNFLSDSPDPPPDPPEPPPTPSGEYPRMKLWMALRHKYY